MVLTTWKQTIIGAVPFFLGQVERIKAEMSGEKSLLKLVSAKAGDVVLDLGCGYGVHTKPLSKLVGPKGKVVAVDPDKESLAYSKKTLGHLENVTFGEGSTADFPNMGTETYDLVFCRNVLHFVHEKEQFFVDAYASLKPGGTLALSYGTQMPALFEKVTLAVNPENADCILHQNHCCEARDKVEEYCRKTGFNVTHSSEYLFREPYANMEECLDVWSVFTDGVPPEKLKERLEKFVPPLVEDGKVVLEDPTANLIAVKP